MSLPRLSILPCGAGMAPGKVSKTRCEYFPVRSAPPSMAPQGFGNLPRCHALNMLLAALKPLAPNFPQVTN
ncbi:hypothetical protein C7H08_05895 [Marinobacter halophilus]|uniref:Uncharacterized protein n=1 Tax=Marinobacter halophilus TaxID=1323740 RepID=A0A2T1KG70_9GAMM|nr:hypothetical protein C7H08_05895 [Marinobacter halophilus]